MHDPKSEIFELKKRIEVLETENKILNREIESIIDSFPGLFIKQEKNGCISRINKNLAEYLNLPKNEIIGKNIYKLLVSKHIETFRKEDLEIIENGNPELNISEKIEFPKGEIWVKRTKFPYFNNKKEIIGIFSFFIDLGDYDQIAEKLKESEEKYKILFEQAPDSIYLIDPETERLIEFNQKSYENLAYTREEFKNLKVSDIEYYDSPDVVLERMKKLIELEQSAEFETKHKTKDGSLRDMYVSIKIITIQGKKLCQIICKDITLLKEIEKRLRISEKKYQKEYEIANFYKDILTHNISNILQSIISTINYYNVIKKDFQDLYEFEDLTNSIQFHIQRIVDLISNIRILSKLDKTELKVKNIDLFETLHSAIKVIRKNYYTANLKVEFEGLSEDLKVFANELIVKIFENILSNSIRHNKNIEEIKILIKINRFKEDNENFIKIEFIDQGIGIPDEAKQFIFKRNYHEDPSKRGMGLGLTLVHQIVEKLNGKIWVENRIENDYHKGSKFILLLKEYEPKSLITSI